MTKQKLTVKQEKFCINLFCGMSQREAYIQAGYSDNQLPATIDRNACLLRDNPKVEARIHELLAEEKSRKITSADERKEILSEIERAKISDFVDENGNLDISNRSKLKNSAVQEIKTERTLGGIKTTLKLRDPVNAIAEHNKMDRIYSEATDGGAQVAVTNFVFILPDGSRLTPKELVNGNSNS